MKIEGSADKLTLHKVKLQVRSHWQRTDGAPRQAFTAQGQQKPLLPVKHDPSTKVILWVSVGDHAVGRSFASELSKANIDLEISNKLTGSKFSHSIPPGAFQKNGSAKVEFQVGNLLKSLKSKVNSNLIEASVRVTCKGATITCQSENLLHILIQKLVIFIPGVCGSNITVASHPNEQAYIAMSLGVVGDQPATWLAMDDNGDPTADSTPIKLDLLRKALKLSTIYAVEEQDAIVTPRNHPALQKTVGGEATQLPHFYVQAYPYDWRGRLERVVDCLAGGGNRNADDPAVPPYACPPSIGQILQDAKKRNPFLHDKLSIACHSTGGLITRAALNRPEIAQHVEKAFFINVPFWGAPKSYYVYLSGDMLPVIANKHMQALAPRTPIIYYLAPTERYPDRVANINTVKKHNRIFADELADDYISRSAGQNVGDFMYKLIRQARAKSDYPSASEIQNWSAGIEADARAFHAPLAGEPSIGWDNCLVFWSERPKNKTPGPVWVNPNMEPGSNIHYEEIAGDGTVPTKSQKADFPQKCLKRIPSNPEHVPAPNEAYVWEQVATALSQ